MDQFFILLILIIIPLLMGCVVQKYQNDNRIFLSIDQLSKSYWNGASACSLCALIAYFLMAMPMTLDDFMIAILRLGYWNVSGYAVTLGFHYLNRHKKPTIWIKLT